jgi:hypothetical protein
MILYEPPTPRWEVVTARNKMILALVLIGLIVASVISVSILGLCRNDFGLSLRQVL